MTYNPRIENLQNNVVQISASNLTAPEAVIDVSSSNAALRITQRGSGEAFRVEDDTNPDSSPFVIDSIGSVGIGTSTPLRKLHIEGGGMAFADPGGTVRAIHWGDSTTNIFPITIVGGSVSGNEYLSFNTNTFSNTAIERMRIDSAGRVAIGQGASVESKLTIGGTLPSNTYSIAVNQNTIIPSSTPNAAWGFYNTVNTEAASFTLENYRHYHATQGTIGSGSAIVNQIGFLAEGTLTGATGNYGFYGNIPSGTGRYNFYAGGTADNYFAGNVGIGQGASGESKLTIGGTLPSNNINSIAVNQNTTVPNSTTNAAWGFHNTVNTEPASFTLGEYRHYYAAQGTIGAGSAILTQIGFLVESNVTGATNNYGFISAIPSGTGRYNFFAGGTAPNYFAGKVGIQTTSPDYPLTIAAGDAAISLKDNGGTTRAYIGIAGIVGSAPTNALRLRSDQGGIVFVIGTGDAIEAARIDSNGRVGIGTAPVANTLLDVNGTYASNIVAVAASDINCSLGNYFTKSINGNTTFTVSNVPASRNYAFTLELEHTSGAITWFSGVEWPDGTAPTLTTGKTHLFIFQTDNGGTRWRASSLTNYTT